MPWYVWLYLAYLATLTGVAAFDDLKDREKLWRVTLDLLTGALEIGFVLAWYRGVPRLLNNAALPVLFIFSLFWFAQGGVHAARHQHQWMDGDETPTERVVYFTVGSVVAVMSVLPAIAAGAVLSFRVLAG